MYIIKLVYSSSIVKDLRYTDDDGNGSALWDSHCLLKFGSLKTGAAECKPCFAVDDVKNRRHVFQRTNTVSYFSKSYRGFYLIFSVFEF